MKRIMYLLVSVVCMMTVAACQTTVSPSTGAHETEREVKGVDNVDVIHRHDSIEGLERIVHFYDKVKGGTAADLRIVQYTIEGDPIVTDLRYDGKLLEVIYDTTRDKFGVGEVMTMVCGDLIKEVNPTNTTYLAVDCGGEPYDIYDILSSHYNLAQQDFFAFTLKSGVNNEYTTLTSTVEMDKVASEAQTIGDLQATTAMQQEVYKRLVLANYLEEKNFTNSCDTNGSINYDLQVRINDGQRDYEWNACDESADGVKFTDIANYIIEQSKQEQSRQQKATVQGYVFDIQGNEMLIGENLTLFDYEALKDELPHINFEDYPVNFMWLEGVEAAQFKRGDKIRATVEGEVSDTKPWRLKVEEIERINIR